MSGDREHPPVEYEIDDVLPAVLIAGMMASIVASLVAVLKRFDPNWAGEYLAALTFLACLEAIFSSRVTRERDLDFTESLRFRLVEWIVFLVALRLVLLVAGELSNLPGVFQRLATRPGALFDLPFFAGAAVLFSAWYNSILLAGIVSDIGPDPRLAASIPEATEDGDQAREGRIQQDRRDAALRRVASVHGVATYWLWVAQPSRSSPTQAALRRITTSFAVGAAVVCILASLSRVDTGGFLQLSQPATGALLSTFTYFALGLILIAYTYMRILRTLWRQERLPVPRVLDTRWLVMIGAFVTLAALLAVLFPTRFPTSVLGWIAYRVGSWLEGIPDALSALLYPSGDPLPGDVGPSPARGFADAFGGPMYGPFARGPGIPWWEAIRSGILWLAILGIVGYALYRFLRDRGGLLKWLSGIPLLRWIAELLDQARHGLRELLSGAQESLQRRQGRTRSPDSLPWPRYLSLRSLPPAQLVRYLYLSTLRRAREIGWARSPHQTPHEYRVQFNVSAPDTAEDMTLLTAAFVEARYGRRALAREELGPIRRSWRRLRGALRALRTRGRRGIRQPEEGDEPDQEADG